jgi:hypothetical protein
MGEYAACRAGLHMSRPILQEQRAAFGRSAACGREGAAVPSVSVPSLSFGRCHSLGWVGMTVEGKVDPRRNSRPFTRALRQRRIWR